MAISLIVNNKSFEGWKEATIIQSLDGLVGQFNLSIFERLPKYSETRSFKIGDACKVVSNNNLIMEGYIEEVNINYDFEDHAIQISGRDQLCDMVDCSFISKDKKEYEWKELKIKEIIEILVGIFGIVVQIDSIVEEEINEIEENFTANPGDTIYELVNKLCRSRAILAVSYGNKKTLTLTRAGTNKMCDDSLILGKNILSGSLQQSSVDRFSLYVAKGYGEVQENVDQLGVVMNIRSEDVVDAIIASKRRRPLVLLSEKVTTIEELTKYANWEKVIRAGRSGTVSYKVQGWEQKTREKKPWTINSFVNINDKFLNIEERWLISQVEFNYNESEGTTTTITAMPKGAFELIEEPLEKIDSGDFKYIPQTTKQLEENKS